MTLNYYAKRVHEANHKWWHDARSNRLERNKGELICLMHSEISEAMEGERKGLMDDHLPHRKMAEVELADALIRVFDYAGGFSLDIDDKDIEGDLKGMIKSAMALPMNRLPDEFNRGEELARIHATISRAYQERDAYYAAESLVSIIYEILLYAGRCGYDLQGAFEEKMAYNAVRHDHTHEARAADGGKKW
jgi:NTP pyrophosphatase (non-canonical NTP hydrolase)